MSDKNFEVNDDFYNQELERIKKEDADKAARSNFTPRPQVLFYEMKDGDNNLFILPPYSTRGEIFKKVYKHWELPPDGQKSHNCIEMSHPYLNIKCKICEVIYNNELLGHDLDYYKPDGSIYMNVIDRDGKVETWEDDVWDDEQKKLVKKDVTMDLRITPQVCRVTPFVYNQLVAMMGDPSTRGYQHPYQAICININKHKKVTKSGDQIRYAVSYDKVPDPSDEDKRIPYRTKIHKDEKIIEDILSKIPNLDDVFYNPRVYETDGPVDKSVEAMINFFKGKKPADTTAIDAPRPETSKPDSSAPFPTGDRVVVNFSSEINSRPPGSPECYGKFSKPVEGYSCDTCPLAVVCEIETK